MAIQKSKIDAEYRAYLSSQKWKDISYKKKQQANFTCATCHKRHSWKELQVHHLDYRYLYREEDGMHTLQVLCDRCHKKHHQDYDDEIAHARWWRAQRVDWFGLVQPEDEFQSKTSE